MLVARVAACCALAATVLSACGGAPKHVRDRPPRATANARHVAFIGPARWFPVADTTDSKASETDPDGSVRSVEHGLRLVEHPDGRLERAFDVLPHGGAIGTLRLPERLGGGYLFSAIDDRATVVFRAAGWTDRLIPLVRLPFEANSIKVGFDRLYAISNQTHAVMAIDAATGGPWGLGALPASAAYGGMAFSDGWLGAVEVDVRGVLVTFDAGLGWHAVRMPLSTPGVFEEDGRIVLGTARGNYTLLPTGELARTEGSSSDSVFGDIAVPSGADLDEPQDRLPEPPPSYRAGLLGARPLAVAVVRGVPVAPEEAVVAANGALARVSLRDGSVLAAAPEAYPAGESCQGVRLGTSVGFVCGQDRGKTRVYVYEPPLSLEPVLEFPEPRYVAPSGNGGLVIRGSCATSGPTAGAAYCVRAPDGALREINVEGDRGAERVIGLSNGDIAVLVPPRLGAQGSLHVIDKTGRSTTRSLALAGASVEIRELLTRGFWTDGLIELEPGVIAGWVVGAQRKGPAGAGAVSDGMSDFVGLRVSLDGKVRAGVAQLGVERAGFAGPLAFVTNDHGSGLESMDFGATWTEVALPESGEFSAETSGEGHERGCTSVGCSVGSWLRVGWGTKTKTGDLVRAADPPKARLDPSPIVGWAFECTPTGDTEGPTQVAGPAREGARRAAPAVPPIRARGNTAELETSAWRPFLGMPGPELGHDDVGFDFGTEDQVVQLRGYAWGGKSAAWDRSGTWLVRVIDRFDVKRAIWSTAASRTPWVDAASAAEFFGSDPSHRVANEWSGLYDTGGDGAIVTMRAGNTLSIAVAERDRALVVVGNADDFALDRPAGAAKVSGRWYMGTVPGPRAFHILGIEGGTMRSLGSYPRYVEQIQAPAWVVRTVRGDALGIWVVARGQPGLLGGGDTWFIYPVDAESGQAGPPLVIPRTERIRAPRPCGPDEDGWMLVHEFTPFARLEFPGLVSPPTTTKVEARLIAGAGGLCVDALAAQVEGDPPKDLRPRSGSAPARQSVVLALTDRATDRRWGFRCTP
jgi:hypothetical protein